MNSADWLDHPSTTEDLWAARLLALGLAVQRHLAAAPLDEAGGAIEPVAVEGGDAIYPLDRHVEPVILQAVETWPAACTPLVLIAEGMGPDGRHRVGPQHQPARFRVLVDPIDGTRGLMYGKRSAWFLAAVARDRGDATRLSDTFASVLVELPPPKQEIADAFAAVVGRPVAARRGRVGGDASPLTFGPNRATTLRDGFAHVASFFPGTKVLAARLLEHIAETTLGPSRGGADVFDDQYISTGGQMVALMVGQDRFCCDLRPLFHASAGLPTRSLECHPYDVAGALAARQAGVILTDGFGRPLDAPLDVHHGVHWCGYCNAAIRDQVQPVLNAWLADQGITLQSSSGVAPPGS